MIRSWLLATVSLAGLAGTAQAADIDLLPGPAARIYRAVRPTPAELKWKHIPWLTDLSEGIKQAKEEKRPLLIWTAGDDPLERC